MNEIPDNPDQAWFARTLIELRDEVRALRDELRYAPSPLIRNAETIEAMKPRSGASRAARSAPLTSLCDTCMRAIRSTGRFDRDFRRERIRRQGPGAAALKRPSADLLDALAADMRAVTARESRTTLSEPSLGPPARFSASRGRGLPSAF